jgi:hypothetical protein
MRQPFYKGWRFTLTPLGTGHSTYIEQVVAWPTAALESNA